MTTDYEAFNAALKKKRDEYIRNHDEGTIGHSIGEALDELVIDDPDRFNDITGVDDMKGSVLTGQKHIAEEVAKAIRTAEEVADSG